MILKRNLLIFLITSMLIATISIYIIYRRFSYVGDVQKPPTHLSLSNYTVITSPRYFLEFDINTDFKSLKNYPTTLTRTDDHCYINNLTYIKIETMPKSHLNMADAWSVQLDAEYSEGQMNAKPRVVIGRTPYIDEGKPVALIMAEGERYILCLWLIGEETQDAKQWLSKHLQHLIVY